MGIENILTGRGTNKSTKADQFITDGNDINNPVIISSGFCKYFTEIGRQFADKIPKGTKSLKTYMITNPNATSLYLVPTSPDEVLQLINSLKSN